MKHIQGVPKKRKTFLNIHIKSERINIFPKIWLDRDYHICGQVSKIQLYNPIIHVIALFQILKRNYAENGHELHARAYSFACTLLT